MWSLLDFFFFCELNKMQVDFFNEMGIQKTKTSLDIKEGKSDLCVE